MWNPARDGYSRLMRRNKHGFESGGDFVYLIRRRRYIPRSFMRRFYAHWRYRHVTHCRISTKPRY